MQTTDVRAPSVAALGVVKAIFIADGATQPMRAVESVPAVAGRGLEGDRYFEAKGEVRQALSVVKKRGGRHERTIREFKLERGGIHVGEALREFRGILTGVPIFEGPDPRFS